MGRGEGERKVIQFVMRGMASLLAFSIFLASAMGCSGFGGVLRVSDGRVIVFEEMIREIGNANIVFVGEAHDDKRHHRFQLAVIEALLKAGAPLAIGLEMFRADSQGDLDHWVEGKIGLEEFVKVYHENWGLPWPLYSDIFLFSRENRIPLIGLNVSGEITKKISRLGFSSLTEEDLKKLPPGISCDVDEAYMDYIRRAYGAHAAKGKSFVNFCEAQMVWDKTMAWRLTEFLKMNPKRTVVVLAGAGHSWKRGIPEQFRRLTALSYAVILPEIPDQIDKSAVSPHDADYILLE